ncbi:hypothetical protein [Paenibacillus sp. MMO-177]|uniref:hypothetical protein n=1 Tax=Paenibacillus sp. MMO-177 TaxID=3081289 RepID=UPI00301A41C3
MDRSSAAGSSAAGIGVARELKALELANGKLQRNKRKKPCCSRSEPGVYGRLNGIRGKNRVAAGLRLAWTEGGTE